MPKYSNKMAYDKSGSDSNMRYASSIKGGTPKMMKSHGNVSPIATTRPQKRDMGRMDIRPMEYRGYADKAFAYQY